MLRGSLFHGSGPDTANALDPGILWLNVKAFRLSVVDERKILGHE